MSTTGASPDSAAAGVPPPGLPPGSGTLPGSSDEPPAALPIGALLNALAQEVSHGLQERLHLIVLEARQVGLRATQMILLAVLAALMACSAWATVLVAIYMACTTHGVSWPVALLIVLLVNVAAAAAAVRVAYRLNSQLGFPATLRMLTHIGHSHPGPEAAVERPGVTPPTPYPVNPTAPRASPPA